METFSFVESCFIESDHFVISNTHTLQATAFIITQVLVLMGEFYPWLKSIHSFVQLLLMQKEKKKAMFWF